MHIFQPYFEDCNAVPVKASWIVKADDEDSAFEIAKKLLSDNPSGIAMYLMPQQASHLHSVKELVFNDNWTFV